MVKENVQKYTHCFSSNVKPPLSCKCFLSALTHITRIRRDFDAANSPRYRDDNTLPHIARFRGEFQETLCKSREAFIARRRLLATDKNRHFLVFDKIYLPFVVSMSIHSTK